MKIKNNKGFTLIELLVVIAIIGFMGSIVLSSLSSARAKSRDSKRISELKSIEKALYIYSLANNGNVPGSPYSGLNDLPIVNNKINCSDPTLISYMNSFYEVLINAKALSSKPVLGNQSSQGYCYVYMSDQTLVAGVSYDQDGKLLSGTSVAALTATQKAKSSTFASVMETTKTLDGNQAVFGVSYGNPSIDVNYNLTTGSQNNIGIIQNTGSNSSYASDYWYSYDMGSGVIYYYNNVIGSGYYQYPNVYGSYGSDSGYWQYADMGSGVIYYYNTVNGSYYFDYSGSYGGSGSYYINPADYWYFTPMGSGFYYYNTYNFQSYMYYYPY